MRNEYPLRSEPLPAMQQDHVADGSGPRSSLRGRSASLSTEHRQTPKANLLSPPLVNPQPQYIAASPARQLISANHGGSHRRAIYANVDITDAALALLNGFLDNLLFSILLTAKSTKLISIRPAVSEVLRPRLAREVVTAADDELGEYMSGGDDEELSEFHGGQEPSGHFELERSWKLTRLRCMVYSRLGDMEEEDEEDYLRQEGLEDTGPGRFSRHIGHITPAAAIFLTSILEHIGENALTISTDIARTRMGLGTAKPSEGETEKHEESHPLIIDDIDVEKIALNSTLGRLWRTWRKRSRVPALSRTLSRESILRFYRKTSSRQSSIGTVETVDEPQLRTVNSPPPVIEDAESIDPADVPLPLSDNEGDEIEAPAFTAKLAVAVQARSLRPRSLFITNPELTAPAPPEHPLPKSASILEYRTHARSYSLPTTPLKTCTYRTPELVIIPPKPEGGQLQPMCEHREPVRLVRKRSHSLEDRIQTERRDSMEPDPYLDTTHDSPSSPVSSMHSDAIGVAIGVAIGHTDMAEAPSPISRGGSRFSSGSSEYEDCEQRMATPTFSATKTELPETQQFDDECVKAPVIDASPQPSLNVYTNAPSAPPPRSPRRLQNQELSPSPKANDTIVETAFMSQPSKPVSQPPRLSPLRELVAAASSTPEEHSPTLQSATRSAGSPEPKSASDHSDRSTRSQTRRIQVKTQMVNASTNTATNSPRSVSPGRERAGVQRVSPPPSKSPSEGFRSRRSESNSSFPDRRPITAGSGTSQVSSKLKGLVGRQGTSTSMRPGDANGDTASDLDQLIESDETLHYTLTPRTMREIEVGTPARNPCYGGHVLTKCSLRILVPHVGLPFVRTVSLILRSLEVLLLPKPRRERFKPQLQ